MQVYNLPEPSNETKAAYSSLDDCVPLQLLTNAIYAKNEDDLRMLAVSFIGDRQGMANTRDYPSHEGEGMHTSQRLPPHPHKDLSFFFPEKGISTLY
jgi:hypothetical protein